MSFLNSLFDIPADWRSRWQVKDDRLVYVMSPHERKILEAEFAVVEDDDDFDLGFGASILERQSLFDQSVVVEGPDFDNLEASISVPMGAGFGPAPAEVEDKEAPAAPIPAAPASDAPKMEAPQLEAPSAAQAPDEPEAAKHENIKHKDPKELTPAELSVIAGSCNPKALAVVVRKGSDGALINSLQNSSMSADLVVEIITGRAPSATVLNAIGRSRFSKDRDVAAALCKNPKTPLHLSRSLIGRISEHDLKAIVRASNLPNALKGAARNRLTK